MDRATLEAAVTGVRVWQRGDHRAPHKPLLLLLALGGVVNGAPRLMRYADVDDVLGRLLRDFGPARSAVHPEYPFWRLQNDGLWEVSTTGPMRVREGNSDPSRNELLTRDAHGGFTAEVAALLAMQPELPHQLAREILAAHFPASMHEELLDAVDLDETELVVRRRKRDHRFRDAVLKAYEERGAVCGLDIRLRGSQLGLDAAHIKWHQAGGPDEAANGLALCSLHRKLFDRGAFTLTSTLVLELSEHVVGSDGFTHQLLGYHGLHVCAPQHEAWLSRKE